MAGLSNIGKIQASLAAVTQETTLALFNFNFDWSIFKVEAPAEYKPVGNALTTTRRNQAEAGAAHRTARKLGSLFNDIIPDTPDLIGAYGIRATEIVKFHEDLAGQKKRPTSDYGAFTEYLGVDGTSIWAAATSSPAAIAVHLLACILARAFPAAEAVAIWEQIVEERKQEVSKFDENESIPIKNLQGMMAASWEIPRNDLASWDSSARAWIRSADAAKTYNCHQIRLIIDNIDLPVHTSLDVYKSVMETWTTCMRLMNNLICGNGQAIYNGALLVAFRAWHIFPDLMILRNGQLVRQNDPLVKPGGMVTIGLERAFKNENRIGVNWTLSLTHFRFYADQEIREGTLNSTKERITVEDMWMFLTGFLLAYIDLTISDLDYACEMVHRLFPIIWNTLEETPKLSTGFRCTWLYRVSKACTRYKDAQDDRAYLRKLASLGYKSFKRRFPGSSMSIQLPFGEIFRIVEPKSQMQLFHRLFWEMVDSRRRTDMIVRYDFTELENSVGQFAISSVAIEAQDLESRILISTTKIIPVEDNHSCVYVYFQLSNPSETIIVCGELLPLHIIILKSIADGLDPENIGVLSDPPEFIAAILLEDVPSALILFEGTKVDSFNVQTGEETDLGSIFPAPSKIGLSKYDFEFMLDNGIVTAPFLWGVLTAFADKASMWVSGIQPFNFLKEMVRVSLLYDNFDEPLIDLSFLSTCFPDIKTGDSGISGKRVPLPCEWPLSIDSIYSLIKPYYSSSLTRSRAFQWIHYLETKGIWLESQMPKSVMAISSENSLFVSTPFLSDPSGLYQDAGRADLITRLPGNIGKPGVVIIVPTEANRMPQKEDCLVEDAPFDGQLQNCYQNITLHLTLTGYELPVQEITKIGLKFQTTWIVGAATSVYEAGNWIGDINPLQIWSFTTGVLHNSPAGKCISCEATEGNIYKDMTDVHIENGDSLTSIDTWDEYFNRPWNATVFRSKGNWAARLAAVCFGVDTNTLTLLLNPTTCHCEINRIFAQRTYEKLSNGHIAWYKKIPKLKWIDRVEEPEERVGRGGKAECWSDSEDSPSVADNHLVNRHPVIVL